MGKGDQRTKRGKIWRGTYGRLRPKEHKRVPPAKKRPKATANKDKVDGSAIQIGALDPEKAGVGKV